MPTRNTEDALVPATVIDAAAVGFVTAINPPLKATWLPYPIRRRSPRLSNQVDVPVGMRARAPDRGQFTVSVVPE